MKDFLSSVLMLVLVTGIFSSEVPGYLKICGRKNPNRNECIKDSVNSLRQKLREGIPELGIETVEPLKLPEGLEMVNTETFKAAAKNVKIYGISDFDLEKVDLNLDRKTLDLELYFDKLRVDADYKVNARIIVPINVIGPMKIDAARVLAKVSLTLDFKNRKGVQHAMVTSMRCKITIGDYESRYIPTPGQDSTLSEVVNDVLNGSKREIINTITANLERAISGLVITVTNKITKVFTYDQLLPNRE